MAAEITGRRSDSSSSETAAAVAAFDAAGIRSWLADLTGDETFADAQRPLKDLLASGVALCSMLNKISPRIVPKVNETGPAWKFKENIANYLRACGQLSVPRAYMFHASDVCDVAPLQLPGSVPPVVPPASPVLRPGTATPQQQQPPQHARDKQALTAGKGPDALPATVAAHLAYMREHESELGACVPVARTQSPACAASPVPSPAASPALSVVFKHAAAGDKPRSSGGSGPGSPAEERFPSSTPSPSLDLVGPRGRTPDVTSLENDVKIKAELKYNLALEEAVKAWISALLADPVLFDACASGAAFVGALKSGIILCQIINKIKPGQIPKINFTTVAYLQRENINNFLKACVKLGVPESDICDVSDLFEDRNPNMVLNTLQALGTAVTKQKLVSIEFGDTSNLKSLFSQTIVEGQSLDSEPPEELLKMDEASETKHKELVAWANDRMLRAGSSTVFEDLAADIRDGVKLIQLSEVVLQTPFPGAYIENASDVWNAMHNALLLFNFLVESTYHSIDCCMPQDVVRGNCRRVMALLEYLRGTFDHEYQFIQMLNAGQTHALSMTDIQRLAEISEGDFSEYSEPDEQPPMLPSEHERANVHDKGSKVEIKVLPLFDHKGPKESIHKEESSECIDKAYILDSNAASEVARDESSADDSFNSLDRSDSDNTFSSVESSPAEPSIKAPLHVAAQPLEGLHKQAHVSPSSAVAQMPPRTQGTLFPPSQAASLTKATATPKAAAVVVEKVQAHSKSPRQETVTAEKATTIVKSPRLDNAAAEKAPLTKSPRPETSAAADKAPAAKSPRVETSVVQKAPVAPVAPAAAPATKSPRPEATVTAADKAPAPPKSPRTETACVPKSPRQETAVAEKAPAPKAAHQETSVEARPQHTEAVDAKQAAQGAQRKLSEPRRLPEPPKPKTPVQERKAPTPAPAPAAPAAPVAPAHPVAAPVMSPVPASVVLTHAHTPAAHAAVAQVSHTAAPPRERAIAIPAPKEQEAVVISASAPAAAQGRRESLPPPLPVKTSPVQVLPAPEHVAPASARGAQEATRPPVPQRSATLPLLKPLEPAAAVVVARSPREERQAEPQAASASVTASDRSEAGSPALGSEGRAEPHRHHKSKDKKRFSVGSVGSVASVPEGELHSGAESEEHRSSRRHSEGYSEGKPHKHKSKHRLSASPVPPAAPGAPAESPSLDGSEASAGHEKRLRHRHSRDSVTRGPEATTVRLGEEDRCKSAQPICTEHRDARTEQEESERYAEQRKEKARSHGGSERRIEVEDLAVDAVTQPSAAKADRALSKDRRIKSTTNLTDSQVVIAARPPAPTPPQAVRLQLPQTYNSALPVPQDPSGLRAFPSPSAVSPTPTDDEARSDKKRIVRAQYEMRKRVAAELLQSEDSYIGSLGAVDELLLKPLSAAASKSKSKAQVTPVEVESIFSNLGALVSCHRAFAASLRARIDKWADESTVADIFLQQTGFFLKYAQYMNNYAAAQIVLRYVAAKSKSFSTLKKSFEQSQPSRITLESYLVMPVQRLPRYHMLLSELKKYTPRQHADTTKLDTAMDAIKTVIDTINKSIDPAKTEATKKVVAIAEQIEDAESEDIVSTSRTFIREGPLIKAERKGKAIGKRPYCFLMSDIIVFCDKSKSAKDKAYSYLITLPLWQVSSVINIQDRLVLCQQRPEDESKDPTVNWTLDVAEEHRSEWESDIRRAVTAAATR
eukprot:m51a1_g11812 putative pleckstrin domain-containing protein (1706) ;mRNA; f:366630-372324